MKPETHTECMQRVRPTRPCSAHDLNFGGECFNCGFKPELTFRQPFSTPTEPKLCSHCGEALRTLQDDQGKNVCSDCFGSYDPPKKGILTCGECSCGVHEENAVWIDDETGEAKGPPDGTPFHTECVDAQERPYPKD